MKKMLAILLALLMMLTGMATAEETTDNNTNISHMLELCQRVDILLLFLRLWGEKPAEPPAQRTRLLHPRHLHALRSFQ